MSALSCTRLGRWLLAMFLLAGFAGAAQAAYSGAGIYRSQCAGCHGDALAGGAGPALIGPAFAGRWHGKAAALTAFIAGQMPMNKPGSLSREEAGLVTGYILAQAAPASAAAPEALATRQGPLPGAAVAYGVARTQAPGDAELLAADPADWLGYNRDYKGQRYAPLDQITTGNAARLAPKCIFQTGEIGSFQASPVVRRGIMFITTAHHVYALNAATCHAVWSYDYQPVGTEFLPSNRGIALYKGMAVRGTLDGHLIALDATDGRLLWDVAVCDTHKGCFINAAPLAFDGRLFVGEAGADVQSAGHVHAFEAATGKPLWTFDLVPTGTAPGAETWGAGAALGGASMWTTISIDPKSRLLYMSVGNPGQDFSGANRPGDNLYTDCLVVLNADTGKLVWYAQQEKHDVHDWDTAAAPMLYEQGGRNYVAVGSKDAELYIYDRDSHALVARKALTRRENDSTPLFAGKDVHVCPGSTGGVQWNGPAFHPGMGMIFINTVDWCTTYKSDPSKSAMFGGSMTMDPPEQARGALLAFDAGTTQQKWVYHASAPMLAGVTPTAGGVVLTGSADGDFLVFDARTGQQLYSFYTGGAVAGGTSTYMVDGKQYVAALSGNSSKTLWKTSGAATLVIFALP